MTSEIKKQNQWLVPSFKYTQLKPGCVSFLNLSPSASITWIRFQGSTEWSSQPHKKLPELTQLYSYLLFKLSVKNCEESPVILQVQSFFQRVKSTLHQTVISKPFSIFNVEESRKGEIGKCPEKDLLIFITPGENSPG